ncbi:uncharacterized protein LOC119340360 [Triticum dicoccoides]|uniref:uncharacterized protein LOC119340360 n=1 Tax=Triticum dicoccoides TaxID=85692 RepID=UPI00189191F4|nr:uncharacterized protein LOC119340360 [Triticum dicoccoides]XP_037468168.1 uncharacterized protein LOC119340360 [Triticum dicoccoides]
MTSSSQSSLDDELTNESSTIFPTNGMLISTEGLERGESSKGRKRVREAIRYASRTPEQIQARRERVRARRQNLTPAEREKINAQRREKRQRMALDERNASQRARRQSLTIDERQEINACRRARRQSLPPEERQALLAQCNASYASKRDALCRDSVALQCPTGSLMGHPSSSSYVFSHPGDDDTIQHMELTSVQCPTSTSVDNPSSPHDGFVYSDSPIESFVADDDDSHMSEEQDDEYFAFAGRGDDEDLVDAFTTDTIVPDLYDRVYHNIPVSTHMLTPKPDCNHCGAKRFQYETSGFCCRSGKINLAHSEPPLELQMLYTSSDPNDVHFRENIRYFNGHFSFTTLGVSLDNRYTNMSSGVYTF